MRTTLRARFIAPEVHALLFISMWMLYWLFSQPIGDGLSSPLFLTFLVADLPISFVAFGVMFTSARYGALAAVLWGVLGTAWWFLIGVAIDGRVRRYQESRLWAGHHGLTSMPVPTERKYSIGVEAVIAVSIGTLALLLSFASTWNGNQGHFDKGEIGNLAFAPGGQYVVFVRSQNRSSTIEKLDFASGKSAAITGAIPCRVSSPAFSPDGEQIAVACSSDERSRIFIMEANVDNIRPLFSSNEQRYDFAPHFTVDGGGIYFAKAVSFSGPATVSGVPSPDSWDLYFARLDGTKETPVTNRRFKMFGVSYSLNGEELAISGELATGQQARLYSVDEPAKEEIPIQPLVRDAAGSTVISEIVLAPDGRSVYFMGGTDGEKTFNYDVYHMDVKGGIAEKLTTANGYATDLCVSDDGKTAAFLRGTSRFGSRPNLIRLFTLDLETKHLRAWEVTGTQLR